MRHDGLQSRKETDVCVRLYASHATTPYVVAIHSLERLGEKRRGQLLPFDPSLT
jgi:hypothetical protein